MYIKTYFSKAILLALLVLTNLFVDAQQKNKQIKVDQIGYLTNSQKKAIVPTSSKCEFSLINTKTNEIVYTGKLGEAKKWSFANETVCIADFSNYNTPGEYYLKCSNNDIENSYNFKIGNNIYNGIGNASIFAFYLARASTPISELYAGIYKRPMGHPDTEVIIHESAASKERPAGSVISSPGGWYDAGDYNKYIVNSGFTTYMLLHFCELYPEHTKNTNLLIPESNNNVPDIIDEILWNLRWMLTMQDPNDGGVYHKLSHKNFNGTVLPHLIDKPRYVVMKSTPAALNLAATCAKAYRVFQPYKELSCIADSCLNVAKLAFEWAQKNPDVYYKQPEEFKTGEYGDVRLADEFAWASIEMYLATKNENYIPNNLEETFIYETPSWPITGTLGIYSLLGTKKIKTKKINTDLVFGNFIKKADTILNRYKTSAYNVSLELFEWGSNSQSANEAIMLLMAYKHTSNIEYYNAAHAILNYINGCNPLNICYVTGFGSNNPKNIHDRRSGGDDLTEPIPGYLVGGSNIDAKDDCGDEAYMYREAAIRYVDKYCSYSTNEIAINWNAVYALLVNAIQVENKNLENKK